MKTLDIEAVQAFVLAAELKSFTRAAEAMDTTQSAVSLKIKRLEDGLGRRLLERYRHSFIIGDAAVKRGEALFRNYGAATILFARFVFGMRVIAGPMAGILRMPWRTFALFNLLGATLWVAVISCLGFFFGSRWSALMHFMKRFDVAIAVVFVCIALLWWRTRRGQELV